MIRAKDRDLRLVPRIGIVAGLVYLLAPSLLYALERAPMPDRGGLLGLLKIEDLGVRTVMLALGIAVFLGGAHALSPGHGKTVVAAYLVGSRGRLRDAVFLGIVVTATHTASVILLGVFALYFAERSPERFGPWLGFVSGALIVVIGFLMFLKRLGPEGHAHGHDHSHFSAQSHAHDHPHSHPHLHDHERHNDHEHPRPHEHVEDAAALSTGGTGAPTARPTLGTLLSLGVSGGMAPCPDAIAVILAAVAYRKILVGLMLVLAFSVGLAAALISIGAVTVLAGNVMVKIRGEEAEASPWLKRLPVVSAVVVMVLGAAIAVTSLLQGGVIAWGS